MLVGIDLGTTNSAIAVMEADGPRLIPNALGEVLTPSVVAIDEDGNVLVGRPAKELQVLRPGSAAYAFKRYMGTDWKCRLGKTEFTPERLSSLVLQSLKQDAEAALGEPIERAIITVPAYFNEMQRRATINAGRIAGLRVERILNEPTAAAIAYGLHDSSAEKLAAVIDLGGGTFDVSIVELFEGTLEVRASSGECFLGGEDFTDTLAARILESQGYVFERAELEHPALVARLRQQCEIAKRQLSRKGPDGQRVEEHALRIPSSSGEISPEGPEFRLTSKQFAEWTEHILRRIESPIRRALGDAGLRRDQLDEVILVGGATRMPTLVQRVAEIFEKPPRCSLNPDEVVALGAGVQAGLMARNAALDDMVVTDVAPFTLGVHVCKLLGSENRDGYFLPIINRNTTIPVSRVQRVGTVQANQTEIRVQIYQGEHRRVEDNLLLGEFLASGIPPGPAGQEIDIRFTYDLNGVLEVEATVVASERKFSHVITRYAEKMSKKEIADAVAAMQSLKTHPREETVNRHLLKRAERLYQELPHVLRDTLQQLLDGFEEALEMQDSECIARNRAVLIEFLDRFDSENNASYDEPW